MAEYKNRRILVFCKTKRTADQLEFQLKRCGYDAMAIHGDKEQRQREFILDRFRKDSRMCVVATDVAARGLDIKQLEIVVNYDFPMQIDDYVHRIGRTGRAGQKGASITMISKKELQLTPAVVKSLVDILTKSQQVVPPWMQAWADERKFPMRRGREQYNRYERPGPQLHYNHANRPSFDPSAVAPNAPPKQFFGLAAPAPTVTQAPFKSNTRVMRFDDSDDDEAAAKKSRKE